MDFFKKQSIVISLAIAMTTLSVSAQSFNPNIAVGSQYDSTHVYVNSQDLDKFVNSFVAIFGGQPSKVTVTNVLPVPSTTKFRYIMSPVGTLSVFAYETPIPYPFGQERYGYLVTDMDKAIIAARQAGAEVIVSPFKDAIGRDAVIQWNGGVKTQLYWHSTPPNYQPLKTIPDNRVYISPDRADEFVKNFIQFANGKVIEDNSQADAGEIGIPHANFSPDQHRITIWQNAGHRHQWSSPLSFWLRYDWIRSR